MLVNNLEDQFGVEDVNVKLGDFSVKLIMVMF